MTEQLHTEHLWVHDEWTNDLQITIDIGIIRVFVRQADKLIAETPRINAIEYSYYGEISNLPGNNDIEENNLYLEASFIRCYGNGHFKIRGELKHSQISVSTDTMNIKNFEEMKEVTNE